MPIKSNQPNKTVIYEIFNHDDTTMWIPYHAALLNNVGDVDQFEKTSFRIRILIQSSPISRSIIFDDKKVHKNTDEFVVNAGDVTINGQVANMYYGG